MLVTGVARPLSQGGLVTVNASIVLFAMIHREGMRAIVAGGRPGCGCMTIGAVLVGEHARMKLRLAMTTRALCGCAFENVVFVAIAARNGSVRAIQLESGAVMIETGRFPGAR